MQVTINEALRWAAGVLGGRRLEAEVLLAYLLGRERIYLLASPRALLDEQVIRQYRQLVQRRQAGYPLQYLTGRQEFMSLEFVVDPAVLIPRPETELLVEVAIDLAREMASPVLVDVGTGSGAIALSLAYYLPQAGVVGTEISPAALKIAELNARRLGLSRRVVFLQGDLLDPLAGTSSHYPDFIVSNPPYIPTSELACLPADVRYEPREAMDGGQDGLAIYRRLIPAAAALLRPGGCLLLEIGWNQGRVVRELVEAVRAFRQVKVKPDLAGHERVVVAWR